MSAAETLSDEVRQFFEHASNDAADYRPTLFPRAS
jgi:hypothetical protein